VFLFFYFGLFVTVSQKKCLGNGRSGTAVFRENLVTICTHDRRLWGRRTFPPPGRSPRFFAYSDISPKSTAHQKIFYTKPEQKFLQRLTQLNFCDRRRWVYFKLMQISRTWHFCGAAINKNYVIHVVRAGFSWWGPGASWWEASAQLLHN